MIISLCKLRKFISVTLLTGLLSLNSVSTMHASYTTEEQTKIDQWTTSLFATIEKTRTSAYEFANKTVKKRSAYAADLKKITTELKHLVTSLNAELAKTHNPEFREIITISESVLSETQDHLDKTQHILATASNIISMLAQLRSLEPTDAQLADLEQKLTRLYALITPINAATAAKIADAIKMVQIGRKGPLTVNNHKMDKAYMLCCFYAMK